MSFTVIRIPYIYSFAGNPVIFELETDSPDAIDIEVIFRNESKYASFEPFQAGSAYKVKIDLSGYLSVKEAPLNIEEGYPVTPLADFMLSYSVKIGEDYSYDGYVFQGGISNRAFLKLAQAGYDIFSYRLGSHFEQFLFTTRTHAREIRIREAELYPFVFIHPGIDIEFKSGSGNIIKTDVFTEGTICTMDIDAVRNEFKLLYDEVPNHINVCPAGELSFSFNILPEQDIEEKYLIRFRNSLGTYEQIEVTGRAIHNPTLNDENLYNSLNDLDFYVESRDRTLSRNTIEVETGYKTRAELPFVLDLIKSSEVYFLFPNGDSFRCHVTSDNIEFYHRMIVPTSIPLTVREVTDEEFYTPVVDFSIASDTGIFDDTFDDTFE